MITLLRQSLQLVWQRAIRSLEIARIPDSPELSSERLAWIGDIPVFGAGWGTLIHTDSVLQQLVREGVLTDALREQLATLGFSGGYRYPLDTDLCSPETQEHIAGIGAELALRTISARKWSGVDVLVVASSTVQNHVPERMADLLKKKNIGVNQTLWYAQACNSGFAGLNDVLLNPNLQGARVALVSMDTLSGTMTDVTDPLTFLTFGNNGGSMAFVNGKEIVHTDAGRTMVEFDTDGVIKAVPPYSVPSEGLVEPPGHYEFVDERSRKHLIVTKQGIIMDVALSKIGKLEMNGMKTLQLVCK